MIFDPTKDTLPESFGIEPERIAQIVERYMIGSYGEILDRVLNEETDLTEGEKAFFLIDFGVKMFAMEIANRTPQPPIPQADGDGA